MKMLKDLAVTTLLIYLFPGVVLASPAIQNSEVLPGSKIVAGDLSKNEFFIVATNEAPKVTTIKPATKKPSNANLAKTKPIPKQTVAHIKQALSQVLVLHHKPVHTKHKALAQAKSAKHLTLHKTANKNSQHKSKVV